MLPKNRKLKLAIAQINPTVGDYSGNAGKVKDYVRQAEAQGADWVVFSELTLSGYPVWDLANRSQFVREGLRFLKDIALFTRGKKIKVMLGFIDLGPKQSRKTYNAMAVLGSGRILHKQYKTLLPTYDVFLDQIFFLSAAEQKIFRDKGMRVGLSICEDIWDADYAVKPLKQLKEKGADIIINISASPFHRNVAKIRGKLVSGKAKETGAYLIYVNQVGGQDDLIFDGGSMVADPAGKIIYQADFFREGLYFTEISAAPGNKHKVLSASADQRMYDALVLGLRDYARKNGFKKIVLGLSGGIDSALTAAIACDALGPEQVIGVAMPSRYNSPESLRDARELAQNLGCEFRVRPIKDNYDAFMSCLIKAKKQENSAAGEFPEESRITLAMENLQARLRGLQLMYISNDEGALLVSTGNKSEMAMGYCTLYGDMSGGINALGDLYKTEVYRLSYYRNTARPVIPLSSLEKAPTAELRPNQKDQDSLPPYEILDRILFQYIEKNRDGEAIARVLRRDKIKKELIPWIIQRVDQNEYKRRQSPPVLRVSEKAWFGRRMPITNHFRG